MDSASRVVAATELARTRFVHALEVGVGKHATSNHASTIAMAEGLVCRDLAFAMLLSMAFLASIVDA